jgi:hypothetical protein
MRYQVLAFILSCAWSPTLAQVGVEDGQIDLSPLLNGPQTAPVDEDLRQIPSVAVALQALAELPRYVRDNLGDNATLPATDEGDTQPNLPTFAMSAMGIEIHRLSGEYDEIAVDLDVPLSGAMDDLIITYRNSIDVLAESSTITVLRDGVEIAAWQPNAPDGFQTMTLPANTLTLGLNRIVIRAEQSHRIFCGPEASFAIWTDINLARSGINVANGTGPPDMDDFRRAARAQIAEDGTLPLVTAVVPATRLMRDLERRAAALGASGTARLSLESHYTVTSDAVTSGAQARIVLLATSDFPNVAARPEVRHSPQGPLILVISTDTTPDMLDDLLPLPSAIVVPPDLIPGQSTTLNALNADDIVIRSRYRRVDVPFRLPDDWLVLTAQSAQLDLHYRYAENLPEGSLFLIKVNDITVRLLPLFGEGGLVLPELPVRFSARLLKPGFNNISFEAIIPGAPSDMTCPKIESPLLEVSGNTLVNVPTSPRMQIPRLSLGMQRLTPESVALITNLAGPRHIEEIVTSLAVHLVALDDELSQQGMARLTVRSLEKINQVPLDMVSLDRSTAERALTPQRTERIDQASDEAVTEDRFAQPSQRAVRSSGRIRSGIISSWQRVRALAWPGDPPLADWMARRQGQAILLMPDPADPLDLWLIVSASADADDVARALAVGRLDPLGPDGQAALLTADGVWQSWRPAAGAPSLHEPLTLANARAVAGNYASWSPVWFVGLLACFMSISVLFGLSYVVSTRGSLKR